MTSLHRIGAPLLATTMVGPSRGAPGVYVHAKIGIVDDRWLTIGSANLNNRSAGLDTEVEVDVDARLVLPLEHLGCARALDRQVRDILRERCSLGLIGGGVGAVAGVIGILLSHVFSP